MATLAADRKLPAPTIDPTNKPFWDGAAAGVLLIGLCKDTGRHFFYPREVSPFTLSPNVELVPAQGAATIYSFSVVRGKVPYAIAYVQLTEGPRIMTNIVDCDLDELRIGQSVRLVWKPTEEGAPPVPMFTRS